jgi:site-specific DNA-methyltransferase (adenine-specific)
MDPVNLRPRLGDNSPFATLFYGVDALSGLRRLGDHSVQAVITEVPGLQLGSPGIPASWPKAKYEALLDQGVEERRSAQKVALGNEDYVEDYVAHLVQVFRELKRVLRSDGTVWISIKDKHNLKQLLLVPYRVALALQADGWVLRNEIIWHMENPTPDSAKDRLTIDHSTLFLFSHPDSAGRKASYFFDTDAIREPHRSLDEKHLKSYNKTTQVGEGYTRRPDMRNAWHPKGRSRRTTWTVNLGGYLGKAAAPWPYNLVEPMVRASVGGGGVCGKCKAPLVRTSDDQFKRGCRHKKAGIILPTVLDPFAGTGVTGQVAMDYNANFIGIDIDADVLPEVRSRLEGLTHSRTALQAGTKNPVLELFGS